MDTYPTFVSCFLTLLVFVNCAEDNVTTLATTRNDVESNNPTTVTTTVKEMVGESGNVVSLSSTTSPESAEPPSRPYYRNVMRVSSVRRTGRTFSGENTLESPIRPTASAQEYPRGTGVGSFAEVGMAITKTAHNDNRNGRSFLGSTEASVSSASFSFVSLKVIIPLILSFTLKWH